MVDARQVVLALITLGSLITFLMTMAACRRASERHALEWRRGRLLREAQCPGAFRLGLGLMRGTSFGLAFGAVRAATALLDVLV